MKSKNIFRTGTFPQIRWFGYIYIMFCGIDRESSLQLSFKYTTEFSTIDTVVMAQLTAMDKVIGWLIFNS